MYFCGFLRLSSFIIIVPFFCVIVSIVIGILRSILSVYACSGALRPGPTLSPEPAMWGTAATGDERCLARALAYPPRRTCVSALDLDAASPLISSRGIRHLVPRAPCVPYRLACACAPVRRRRGSFHVVRLFVLNFMALGLMSAVTLLAPVRFRVTFASVGGRWAAWGVGGGGCLGGRLCEQLIKGKENMICIF